MFYVLFVGVWCVVVVVSTVFQFLAVFCPEQDDFWIVQAERNLCVSLRNFLFLPLPAPGEIVLWLRICKADIPLPFPSLKNTLKILEKFFCQPEAVKWGLRVFLFVTKLYMFFQFPLAGSQWAKDNLYIQNCLYYRLFLTQLSQWGRIASLQYPSCVNV